MVRRQSQHNYDTDYGASLVAQRAKNLPAMQQAWVQFLGQEDPWRRKWQPTPVFLPGESHGQRSLVGYSSWGREELDTTEQLTHTWYELQHQTELTGWCHERHTLALPARGAGTLIPSAQRLVWAAKQPLGNAALGALFA